MISKEYIKLCLDFVLHILNVIAMYCIEYTANQKIQENQQIFQFIKILAITEFLFTFFGKDLLVWPTIPGPEYDTSSSQIFTAKTFQTKYEIILLWSRLLHLSLKQIEYLVVQSFTLVYFKDNMTCFQRFTHLFKWHKYQSQTRG